MLTNIYVVDYIVRDLEAAKDNFDRIFATDPLCFNPEMAPGAQLNAIYYQMPGEGAGVHAVGIFDHSGDAPDAAHDGVTLLGILCDDLDTTITEIEGRGLQFHFDQPNRYAVGRNNLLGPLNGVTFAIAQHDPSGYWKAQSMMKTRAGSHDFGDPTQSGLLDRLYVIDIVVRDLNEATANYRALLGVEPIDTSGVSNNPDYRSIHFPAPGDGRGIHSIGLFQPISDTPQTEGGKRLKQHLDTRGEGVFLIGFLVDDIGKAQVILEGRGLKFRHAVPQVYAMGRGNTIPNVFGTDLWFAQHNPGAYQQYRALAEAGE